MHPIPSSILRIRTARLAAVAACAAACFGAQAQSTTVCGPEVLDGIAKQLQLNANLPESEQLALQAKLYDEYAFCAEDAKNVPPGASIFQGAEACSAKVSYLGSVYYEEMSCCGYDPQRRSFACPVKVKRTTGFGAGPTPGSREYVLNCVADPTGRYLPVGQDSVHLSNALAGSRPNWQFAVVANAVDNLQTVQPMDRSTRNARSILSWNLKPTNCDYRPIWGNVIDYKIRLDQ